MKNLTVVDALREYDVDFKEEKEVRYDRARALLELFEDKLDFIQEEVGIPLYDKAEILKSQYVWDSFVLYADKHTVYESNLYLLNDIFWSIQEADRAGKTALVGSLLKRTFNLPHGWLIEHGFYRVPVPRIKVNKVIKSLTRDLITNPLRVRSFKNEKNLFWVEKFGQSILFSDYKENKPATCWFDRFSYFGDYCVYGKPEWCGYHNGYTWWYRKTIMFSELPLAAQRRLLKALYRYVNGIKYALERAQRTRLSNTI